MVSSRLELLHSVRDLTELRGLEIGALTNPIITPRDLNGVGEIFYLDHLSTQDLKEKYKELEKDGKLNKYMSKRRKKNSSKDRKALPWVEVD